MKLVKHAFFKTSFASADSPWDCVCHVRCSRHMQTSHIKSCVAFIRWYSKGDDLTVHFQHATLQLPLPL